MNIVFLERLICSKKVYVFYSVHDLLFLVISLILMLPPLRRQLEPVRDFDTRQHLIIALLCAFSLFDIFQFFNYLVSKQRKQES